MKSSAQFLTDPSGKRIAIQLPIGEYNKLMEQVEELEAVKAFDKAVKRKTTFQPFSKAMAEIRSKSGSTDEKI
jgi:hypothetical protein